ncbi:hypothetical protein [Streptomyces sp. NPDC058268]|uniref:hypothetical protein n=1 Tax=Streptomyces sp. NPDC058268 TaxID=3346413 RepID=UPI0036F0F19C
MTTQPYPCRDPAVWLVFHVDKASGENRNSNACGAHLNRLLATLIPEAEFSREMFRVIAWESAMAAKENETRGGK